jgi:hypothetical protein
MATIRLLVDAFPGAHVTKFKRPPRSMYERTADGCIKNCALACGDDELNCQTCKGECPDAEKIKRERGG